MAKANSTVCICGITFARNEVFGPATLHAMFGSPIPSRLRVARDGSVSVLSVARYLQQQGEHGLQRMIDESAIVQPRNSRNR
ncbi:TPA: hypothetical protein QDA71_005505 [Burkholderia vietnamiensis]|uniref:hypothetical protein n=1 Tax=Burkholderia vietnamiensis TaxID=60552 RepID=UPI001588A0A8|nr:hypothetical protein [Burkholderia vietnamiensis]HDR8948439.1 hypothetical protein [Burkholderia vietnamiensis]HDR9210682.1 hypothetical protein [Burkholderia vietnamiensis]